MYLYTHRPQNPLKSTLSVYTMLMCHRKKKKMRTIQVSRFQKKKLKLESKNNNKGLRYERDKFCLINTFQFISFCFFIFLNDFFVIVTN